LIPSHRVVNDKHSTRGLSRIYYYVFKNYGVAPSLRVAGRPELVINPAHGYIAD